MATTPSLTARSERRRYPRQTHRLPVVIECDGAAAPIDCETVDVSAGGMRVEAPTRIPVGPCRLTLDPMSTGDLSLAGLVLDETIDLVTGVVTARIAFGEDPEAARARLEAVIGIVVPGALRAPRARRRRRALAASGAAVLLLAVAARIVLDDGPGPGSEVSAGRTTGAPGTSASGEGSATTQEDRPGETSVPASSPDPAPSTSAPVEVTSGAPATADTTPATSPPTAAPAPMASRVEHADSSVRVHLAEDPDETTVTSSVGPSAGVDDVRVHLEVMLPQQGMSLSIAVLVENRGSGTLTFPDGFDATVTALRDGAAAATAAVRSDITELAPGEVVSVEGLIDLGSPGDYDFTIDLEVAQPAASDDSTQP